MPKQFVPINNDLSTFQETLRRLSSDELFARPIVITSTDSRFMVAEQTRAINAEADIILEPERRDSAAAVAAATEFAAARYGSEAIVLVLAADHVIEPITAFLEACHTSLAATRAGHIVTFGIVPTHAATAYGYIRPGAELPDGKAYRVDAFVEKPNAEFAERYVADGYLWNSGNFIFPVDVMRRELEHLAPDVKAAARDAVIAMTNDLDFLRLDGASFRQAPKISIDYAVMERTTCAAVVPAPFSWSDVGTWDAVWSISQRDANKNAVSGTVELIDTENCLVRADDGILTTVIGGHDLIIVAMADVVMVVAREKAEAVKTLVENLRSRKIKQACEHRRIYRPWGYYQSIDEAARYHVKRIVVKPGAALSLQKHFHRSEHWVVAKGTAEITVDNAVKVISENESTYIPIGSVHRLVNPGKIPVELIEVQVGSYLGEDDIVRLQDIYQR
jgi:mannose-1-phosphate guanylyltransferase/mannose-6-phosphate isomerase